MFIARPSRKTWIVAENDEWIIEPLEEAMEPNELLIYGILQGSIGQALDAVARGADPELVDTWGRTALVLASSNGSTEVVNSLLDAGANPRRKSPSGRVPVIEAVFWPVTLRVLLARGACARDTGEAMVGNCTALHSAVYHGYLESATMLIAAGADLNAVSSEGETPLTLAAKWGAHRKLDWLKLLLPAGASVSDRAPLGRTPLHLAAQTSKDPNIVEELVAAGATVDERDAFGDTPLMLAAYNGNIECVRALLAHGARRLLINDRGASALDEARTGRRMDIVRLLS